MSILLNSLMVTKPNQVPKMEESSPWHKLYGYGLCKGKPTPKIAENKVQDQDSSSDDRVNSETSTLQASHSRRVSTIVSNGVTYLAPIDGWKYMGNWGYFTPISGDMGPVLITGTAPPCSSPRFRFKLCQIWTQTPKHQQKQINNIHFQKWKIARITPIFSTLENSPTAAQPETRW